MNAPDPGNQSITLPLLVTVKGYQNTPRYYKIKTDLLSNRLRADVNYNGQPIVTGYNDNYGYCYHGGQPPASNYLFPTAYCEYQERIDNTNTVSEVVLPDGRSLQFRYNLYGELAEVILPTGGKLQYDYDAFTSGFPAGNSLAAEYNGQGNSVPNIDRAVVQRRTYPDGSNLEATWTYGFAPQVVNGTSYNCAEVKAYAGTTTGTLLARERHFFLQPSRYLSGSAGSVSGTGYSLWSTGIEWRTETLDASGNVISAVEQDWTQRAAVSWTSGYSQEQPANDNRVNQTRKYLDTGSMAKVENFYDVVNNPIEVKEYGFDQALARRTVTSYSSVNLVNGVNYADDSIRLIQLPLQQSIYDGGGTERARTTYEYDVYSGDGNHDYLTDYASITSHDTNYGTSRTTRGNATGIGRWIKDTNTYVYSYPRYDIAGNTVSVKDARGYVTTLSFADDFGNGAAPGSGSQGTYGATYAFQTLITSPPPNPGEQQQSARAQFDFATGLLTGFKDRNGIISQTIYNDSFNRPTMIKAALGASGVEAHTAMYYAPTTVFGITLAKNDVLTAKDLTTLDDASLRLWTVTDGFGRTKEQWSRDPQGDVKVVTDYDALGRGYQTSNPFRPSLGESSVFSTTGFDLAGRVTSVTTPDGAVVTTDYSGNTVTVTDQIGKKRESETDALGRLKKVIEDPAPGVNYLTTYEYNALGDLTTVSQGGQQRYFMYDSLKRLIRARNSEQGVNAGLNVTDPITGNAQWSSAYDYDNNSNLWHRTDARNVVTTYDYDALNRNYQVSYSDGTPTVVRVYDGELNGKGRFHYDVTSAIEGQGAHTAIDAYDAVGRVKNWRQHFWVNGNWSQGYYMSRNYDLAGHVISQNYPSGRTVTYSYDNAGRTNTFTGNLGDGINRTYATGITYAAAGQMKQEQFGTNTPIYNKLWYNSRQQLSQIRVATTPDDEWWNRGAIINQYDDNCWACAGPTDNGNLKRQEVYVPNNDQISSYTSWTQAYDYDDLNRLKRVREYSPGPYWQQEYDLDRWGNRTINYNNTSSNIPRPQFTVDTSNNRLVGPAGFTLGYDPAGNLTTDNYTGAGQRTYDAENRMTSAQGGSGWQYYTYNATGQRVRRKVDGAETWQVYGMDGELLAEYGANAAPAAPQKEYGYRNGQLLITANGFWTNAVGVSVSGNSLTKTTSDGWGNAGASSTAQISSGDGYVEFTATETNSHRICGLSHGDTNQDWTDVDFGLYLRADGTASVVEAGNYHSSVAVAYASGDHLRVEVQGGVVQYKNNGTVFYTSTVTPNYPLLVDTSLYTNGSTLTNVVIGNAETNLALNKPATQSSTLDPSTAAGKAVDGNTNGTLWDGYSSATNNENQAWWQVDLGNVQTIGSIQIWGRTDCCWEMSSNFYVFVSDNPFTSYDLTTTINQPGVSNYYYPGYANPATIAVNRTGRYVRVQLAASTYLVLAEVQVWNQLSTSSGGIHWLVSDQLGTPRMVFDQTGSLASMSRHDYLPYGEELFALTGGRTTAQGYNVSDGVRQQFTQKERDIETGLDYFGARYYASTQGRFTSADEFTGGPHEVSAAVLGPNPFLYAEPTEPESFNKYSYCLGNPLRYIDPDGHQTTLADAHATVIVHPENAYNITVGVAKAIANIGIGMANQVAGDTGGKMTEPFGAANRTQAVAMVIAEDVTFFSGLLGGRAQVGGVAIADAQETAAFGAEVGNATRRTKLGGTITEPNPAPTGTIVQQDGVTIYRNLGDHSPQHFHVRGEGSNTRIDQSGKPAMPGDPALSRRQGRVVRDNLKWIRKAASQVMKEYRYNRE